MKIKRVICKSGIEGWQARVRDNWENFESLLAASEVYGIAGRLGYESAADLWEDNPIVQGSTEPSDLRIVLDKYNKANFIKPEVKEILLKFKQDKDEAKLITRLTAIGNKLKKQFGGKDKGIWFRFPSDSTGAETVRDIERDLGTPRNCYQRNREYMLERLESSVTEYDFEVYYS
jgi:hypothetical protein